jgi:phosphatidylserine decarboxylase
MQQVKNSIIQYYNRYTQCVEPESVYGESFLKWAYETRLGKLATHSLVKRGWFSRWYGWRMSRGKSARRVNPFVEKYGVRMEDFIEPKGGFSSFNDFFVRPLRRGARAIDRNPKHAVFPADGRHLGFENIEGMQKLLIKGDHLSIKGLLGSSEVSDEFKGGSLIFSRLCPVDYHRFHYPVGGKLIPAKQINGSLYSVNPIAVFNNAKILMQNRRMVSFVETETFGKVALVEIGATCVGSIIQGQSTVQDVEKGQEKGYFKFGGSAVLTIFQAGKVDLAPDLKMHSAQGREVYAQMGDFMAQRTKEKICK